MSEIKSVELSGENLTIDKVAAIAWNKVPVTLAASARQKMQKSRDYIEKRLSAGEVMYGVNTGFGAFSKVRISNADIVQLQKNLIRSHCSGVGKPFSQAETRAIMALRANALARGHSGIRVAVVEKILEFLNADVLPVIPCQGSVGASGDLAPLSHLALGLIGEGEIWSGDKQVSAKEVLAQKKVTPLELQAKEGLSLINGCQVMTAIGLLTAARARDLLWLLDLGGAMSLEALRGSRGPFDALISASRPHPGEGETARNILKLLGPTSAIAESHLDCDRVQDAYSLRCMPAVHGAAKNTLWRTIETLEIEANSSTDNPLVFADDGKILSCGNFHGEPVAFALDYLAIAMTASSSISECRIEKLINPAMSDLPAFLAPNGGLNSGLMIVQVAAASLVSENKILSHPASVDSIPTSADKEDHVSMGTIAARKLKDVVDNAENVTAMEILTAKQALGFLAPLKAAGAVQATYDLLDKDVPFAEEDRVFARDIETIRAKIRSGEILRAVRAAVGLLE
jgi:histidine ammonia-lyase